MIAARTGALLAVLMYGAASPAAAQTPRAMSIGFGVGVGRASIDCSTCGDLGSGDPWRGGWGASGYFSIGYRMTSHVRLDGDLNLWVKRSFSEQRDATLFSAAAMLHYQPAGALDLAAGVGPAAVVLAGGPGYISSSGWAVVVGAGYELPTRTRVKWSPYVRYVHLQAPAESGDNRGVRVLGPANPSSVQVGVGFRFDR